MSDILDLQTFTNIKVVEHLGKGAYGTVTRCKLVTGDVVAVKKFLINDLDFTTLREIHTLRLAKGCQNIVQLIGVQIIPNAKVMLSYHKYDLTTFYRSFTLEDRIIHIDSILSQIISGLKYLYDRGIIHRDIKPRNILLDYDKNLPKCYIADFGLSKQFFCTEEFRDEKLSTEVYTPIYRAPELYYGGYCTYHSDIWALGITILEYLIKIPIFTASTIINRMASLLHNPVSREYFILHIDNIHDYIDYKNILKYNLPKENYLSLTKDILNFFKSSLQISPHDRYNPNNKYIGFEMSCVKIIHKLPLGDIFSGSRISNNELYNVVLWIIRVSGSLKHNARIMVGSIDILYRYVANFRIESDRLPLLGLTCLFILSKFILCDDLLDVYLSLSANIYCQNDLLHMESRLLLALDYIIVSDDVNFIVDKLYKESLDIYGTMEETYKSIFRSNLYFGNCDESIITQHMNVALYSSDVQISKY